MARKKLERFAELKEMGHVFEERGVMMGKWGEFFGASGSGRGAIGLEIGCGAGDYTIALAETRPKMNFIGMDRKGDRVWRGATKVAERGLKNVAFIRDFAENLPEYFGEGELSEIWITFPDPQPKPSKANKRLSSRRFLAIYKLLSKNGRVHIKTDDLDLFDFSVNEMREFGMKIEKEIRGIYEQNTIEDLLKIQTYYESKFLKEGRKIYYARAKFG